jgi:hypothetical protein
MAWKYKISHFDRNDSSGKTMIATQSLKGEDFLGLSDSLPRKIFIGHNTSQKIFCLA